MQASSVTINMAKAIIKDIASNVVIINTTSLLFLAREANTLYTIARDYYTAMRVIVQVNYLIFKHLQTKNIRDNGVETEEDSTTGEADEGK